MNILIFCGYIDDNKTTDANVKIAKRLADEISFCGHNVTLAAIHTNTTPKGSVVVPSENKNYKIALITPRAFIPNHRNKLEQYISKHPQLPRNTAVKRYMLTHPFSAAVIGYSYSKLYKYDIPENYASEFLTKYCRENKTDAAVAITFPFVSVLSVFGSNTPDCKKYIYQLDPYGLHETIPPEYNEPEFFEKADGIFTTEILKQLYSQHKDYKKYSDKIHISAFPTLVKGDALPQELPLTLPENKTNIVFCGSTHDNYRNPKVFLECMEKIISRDNTVAVSFIGPHSSPTLDSFAARYPDNIKIYPSINSAHIPAVFEKADLLLNLGNTYKLQVPSKIFEYFATGKPIIHQQLIAECTCVKYMEKYPLAFCVKDSSDITAEKLYTFIQNSISHTVPYHQISEIYSDNIPENVAKRILENINR